MQTQNDRIGFESVGGLQDFLTRQSEVYDKFRCDYQLGVLRRQFLKSPEAGRTNILSHLQGIASSGAIQAFRHRDRGDNVKQNESCSKVISGRDGVWQGVQRGSAEVCCEQKGPNCSSAPDWGILQGTRTDGQNKAIGMAKDMFRYRPKEYFPQTLSSMCADNH